MTQDGRFRINGRYRNVAVMFWLPAALLAVAPTVWLAGWWRARRIRRRALLGLCPRCRYDLTGNVSGICPECGTEISAATAQV